MSSLPPQDPRILLQQYSSLLPAENYGLLLAVYANLALAQNWTDLGVHILRNKVPVIVALASHTQRQELVFPCSLDQTWSVHRWADLFQDVNELVPGLTTPWQSILMAIVSTDSTVMYYRVHNGIVKPPQHGNV